MITSDEAAKVARAAGLNLADAAALRALADTVPEARRLAKRFTDEPNDPDAPTEAQDFVRNLFAPATPSTRTILQLGDTGTPPPAA